MTTPPDFAVPTIEAIRANRARLGDLVITTPVRLLSDDALYGRLDQMTGRLDTLIDRLNSGQGTAGQLLQDKQLYENMTQAASELRGLIGDIRKDPKKYLNVKVSIF